MILSDKDIIDELKKGELQIIPLPGGGRLQPASVDLRLDKGFYFDGRYCKCKGVVIDPDDFILASTMEKVKIPDYLVGIVEGKSSLARKGLAVHVTAGFIDPGFEGNITLEIKNLGGEPVRLMKGDCVCQIFFQELRSPCVRPYGHEELNSHYQGQKGVTKSHLE